MTDQIDDPRFLSKVQCLDVFNRTIRLASGGESGVRLESSWTGNTRYARNRITTSGDVRNIELHLDRSVRGASATVTCNAPDADDPALEAGIRRAERILRLSPEGPSESRRMVAHYATYDPPSAPETAFRLDSAARASAMQSLILSREVPEAVPTLLFDRTLNLDGVARAKSIGPLLQSVRDAGMVGAGYIEVSGKSRSVLTTNGLSMYFPYSASQYSVTVRDPKGAGSGWAGVDWADWGRIDATKLSAIALDKCIKSRNPVRLEPGRYTTVLEPQAVCDLCASLVAKPFLDWMKAAQGYGPYSGSREGETKVGLRLFDERINITADPMDPDLGFPPFDIDGQVYHKAVWVEGGVLKTLSYPRALARMRFGTDIGLPNSEAMRMSGGTTSIDEMIATTKRGILVTRFSNINLLDDKSLLLSGYTRDGLWLIENGKISKAIKNFRFTESPMFFLNNVEQLGVPQRTFHPSAPVVVPPMKVRDFSFTATSDAI